jgi:hypothetical protein
MQPPQRDAPHAPLNTETDGHDDGLRRFRIGVALGAIVVLVAGVVARFDYDLTLPAKPPPPPPPDKAALRRMDYENPDIYKAYLEQDSSTYGVSRTEPADLDAPFPYEKTEAPRELAPGGPAIDTGMLRISARVEKLEVHSRKGQSAAEHLVLRIENKRPRPVAYRVQTTFGPGSDESCGAKGSLPHNAMAIPANGSVERTECFYRERMVVTVEEIEAMELPPLSYFYVSRIYPPHIGASGRTSANHETPAGAVCSTVPQQSILIGMEKGTVSWRDVVDFYARHRCETYDFPLGYRAFTQKSQYRLPVSTAQIAATPR